MSGLVESLALGVAATLPAAAVAAGAGWLAERVAKSASVRERVWLAGLVASAAVIPSVLLLETAGLSAAPMLEAATASGQPILVPVPRPGGVSVQLLSATILGLSVGGLAWEAVRRVLAALRLRRLLMDAPPASAAVQVDAHRAAVSLGLPALPVLTSDAMREPVLVGLLRPRVILPSALAERASDRTLAMVCAHEFAHARRMDNLIAPLVALVAAFLWLNPFVGVMSRRLAALREEACDARVLSRAQPDERRAYAAMLVDVLRTVGRAQFNPAFTGAARKAMAMRLNAILHPPARTPRWALAIAASLAVTTAAGATAAATLAQQVDVTPAALASVTFEANEVVISPTGAIYRGDPVARGLVPADGVLVLVDSEVLPAGADLATFRLGQIDEIQVMNPRARGDTVLVRITLAK